MGNELEELLNELKDMSEGEGVFQRIDEIATRIEEILKEEGRI